MLSRSFRSIAIVCILSLSVVAQNQSLTEQARELFKKKDYAKSAQMFLAAIKQGKKEKYHYYAAAESFAMSGNRENAFLYINKAFEQGLSDPDILKNEHFKALQDDKRWPLLVIKFEEKHKRVSEFWDNPIWYTPYTPNIRETEKIAGLSKFWSEIKYNFANFDLVKDVDWDKLYIEYLPRVRDTKTTLEYYKALQELCAKLKDGHTKIVTPGDLHNELNSRPPIIVGFIENKIIIEKILDEKLQLESMKVGMEIISVNGKPASQFLEERAIYQHASTRHDLEYRTSRFLLSGLAGESVNLTLKDEHGSIINKTLTRMLQADRSKLITSRPPLEYKDLGDNIGYVAINTFSDNELPKKFAEIFDKIATTNSLVIDIRENDGGNSGYGYEILSYLTNKPFLESKWRTRKYLPSYRSWGNLDDWHYGDEDRVQPNKTKFYSKPIIVLIGRKSFSAAEDFAVAFDYMQRGHMIGEATGGSTGNPLFFKLPGGGGAVVCSKRDTYPDGREFVGVGYTSNKSNSNVGRFSK